MKTLVSKARPRVDVRRVWAAHVESEIGLEMIQENVRGWDLAIAASPQATVVGDNLSAAVRGAIEEAVKVEREIAEDDPDCEFAGMSVVFSSPIRDKFRPDNPDRMRHVELFGSIGVKWKGGGVSSENYVVSALMVPWRSR